MSQFRGTYHPVAVAFWTDEKVRGWDDDTKLLALYLLTCAHRATEGLFRLPVAYMLEDLVWVSERFREAFESLCKGLFIEYDSETSVLLIENALEWNRLNPNQIKGAVNRVLDLPQSPLIKRFCALADEFCPALAESLREAYGKGFESLPEPLAKPIETVSNSQSQSQSQTQAQEASSDKSDRAPKKDRTVDPNRQDAGALVAYYLDTMKAVGKVVTSADKGQFAKYAKEVLNQGCIYETAVAAVDKMITKDLGPHKLGQLANEVRAGPHGEKLAGDRLKFLKGQYEKFGDKARSLARDDTEWQEAIGGVV